MQDPHPNQGSINMEVNGRRRRRRRGRSGSGGGGSGGGGGGGGGGGPAGIVAAPNVAILPGTSVPTDEQLDFEASQLDTELKEKYEAAKKENLDAASLQKLTAEQLAKEAKALGLGDLVGMPRNKLVFDFVKSKFM